MTTLAKQYLAEHDIVVWNTGHGYTEDGQRFAAILLPNRYLYFTDIDRNIDGISVMPMTHQYTSVKEFTETVYNFGHYTGGAYDIKKHLPHLGYEGQRYLERALKLAAQGVGGSHNKPVWWKTIKHDPASLPSEEY